MASSSGWETPPPALVRDDGDPRVPQLYEALSLLDDAASADDVETALDRLLAVVAGNDSDGLSRTGGRVAPTKPRQLPRAVCTGIPSRINTHQEENEALWSVEAVMKYSVLQAAFDHDSTALAADTATGPMAGGAAVPTAPPLPSPVDTSMGVAPPDVRFVVERGCENELAPASERGLVGIHADVHHLRTVVQAVYKSHARLRMGDVEAVPHKDDNTLTSKVTDEPDGAIGADAAAMAGIGLSVQVPFAVQVSEAFGNVWLSLALVFDEPGAYPCPPSKLLMLTGKAHASVAPPDAPKVDFADWRELMAEQNAAFKRRRDSESAGTDSSTASPAALAAHLDTMRVGSHVRRVCEAVGSPLPAIGLALVSVPPPPADMVPMRREISGTSTHSDTSWAYEGYDGYAEDGYSDYDDPGADAGAAGTGAATVSGAKLVGGAELGQRGDFFVPGDDSQDGSVAGAGSGSASRPAAAGAGAGAGAASADGGGKSRPTMRVIMPIGEEPPAAIDVEGAWFLPPTIELEAINTLTERQLKAMRHVVQKSRKESEAAYPALVKTAKKLGFTEAQLKQTLLFIRDKAPIIVHVHIATLVDKFLSDTHLRNQFETKTSRGCLSTASRIDWENRLFNKAYGSSASNGFERVKYGVLNCVADPAGINSCAGYGDSHFVLRKVRLRCSFADMDSSSASTSLASCESYAHVLSKYTPGEMKAVLQVGTGKKKFHPSAVIGTYKELQIHGPVAFNEHIETLSVNPSHRGNTATMAKIRMFCERNRIGLRFHDSPKFEIDPVDAPPAESLPHSADPPPKAKRQGLWGWW